MASKPKKTASNAKVAQKHLTHSTRKSVTDAKRSAVKDRFIEHLATGSSVTAACIAAGTDRRAVYTWHANDPIFAERWDNANNVGWDRLEDRALYLAMQDDDLGVASRTTIQLLKARRPQTFAERSQLAAMASVDNAETGESTRIAIRFVGPEAPLD
jgi:hypothetical protein